MINMQLAMYQMLTNVSINSTNTPENNVTLRVRPADDKSIITNYHSILKNHQKSLKRLTHKQQRSEKSTTTTRKSTLSLITKKSIP